VLIEKLDTNIRGGGGSAINKGIPMIAEAIREVCGK